MPLESSNKFFQMEQTIYSEMIRKEKNTCNNMRFEKYSNYNLTNIL